MSLETKSDLEAQITMKKMYLRAALSIAGSATSAPEQTKVAGNDAAKLKTEIAVIEDRIKSGDFEAAAA